MPLGLGMTIAWVGKAISFNKNYEYSSCKLEKNVPLPGHSNSFLDLSPEFPKSAA